MATFEKKEKVRGNLPIKPPSNEIVKFSELCGFQPKQLEATRMSDIYQYFLYGGTRGPGKSYWLRWHLLRILMKLAGQGIRYATVGLFCEDYPSLTERQTNKIEKEFPDWLGVLKDSKTKGFGFHLKETYGGGFLALRNLDDPSKYQSAEFAAMGIDELTKNQEFVFDILRGSLRWKGVHKPRFCAATNPGGIGHSWVRRLWVDRDFPERYQKLKDEFFFLAALPDDNKYLDESYWDMLDSLPDGLKKAWRYGEWDVFEGQFFSEFRREKHIIKDYSLEPSFTTIGGLDYGNTTALEIIQMDYEGTVVVADECYLPDATNPTERANEIADFLIERELYNIRIIYDTDMEISQISNVGFDKSPIQIFRQVFKERMGKQAPSMIIVSKTSVDRNKNYRQACNEAIKNYMNTKNDAVPKLYFSNKVKQLLLEITEKIIYDPKDPDSLDFLNRGVSKPHCYDALKYAFMEIYKPIEKKGPEKKLSSRQLAAFNFETDITNFEVL